MRELVTATLATMALDQEGNVPVPERENWEPMEALSTFLRKEYKDHISRIHALPYVFIVLRDSVKNWVASLDPETPRPVGVITAVLPAAAVETVKDEFVRYWSGVPRTYEYRFPMPQLGKLPFLLPLGQGVELRNEMLESGQLGFDVLGSAFGRGLIGNAMGAPRPSVGVATLCVQAKGVAMFREASESASEWAIHKAKVCVQLACAVGLFAIESGRSIAPQAAAKYDERTDGPFDRDVALPAEFARTLVDVNWGAKTKPLGIPSLYALPSEPLDESAALVEALMNSGRRGEAQVRIALIARVVSRLDSVEHPPAGQEADCKLAGRIATAAAWAFDANSEAFNASRVLRTAIAIEALFGGAEGEGVVSTLSSRLQYALGTSPRRREHIKENFPKFYALRSKVVHEGRHRLSHDDETQLRWADALISEALEAELKVVPEALTPPVLQVLPAPQRGVL